MLMSMSSILACAHHISISRLVLLPGSLQLQMAMEQMIVMVTAPMWLELLREQPMALRQKLELFRYEYWIAMAADQAQV